MSSYFKRIVDRTLDPDAHNVKPTMVPESISESFFFRDKNPSRRFLPSTGTTHDDQSITSEQEVLPASNPSDLSEGRQDLHKGGSGRRQATRAIEGTRESNEGQTASPADDTVHINSQKLQKAAEPLANEKASIGAGVELAPSFALFPDEQLFLTVNKNANDKSPLNSIAWDQKDKDTSVQSHSHGGFSEKPLLQQSQSADPYAVLMPTGQDAKFSSSAYHHQQLQPEETVVTIHIGKIEVKAGPSQPSDPAPISRRRFSPTLSLADYLRQRSSEGRGR